MKEYLIIGGNSDIGKQVIHKLSSEGNICHSVSRQHDSANSSDLVKQYTGNILTDNLHEIVDPKKLDGLIYCPGTITLKPFRALKKEDFQSDFSINVLGAVRSVQFYLKALQAAENSSIVLFSSVAVSKGMPFHSSIAISKGAIEGLTRSLAIELAPKIRVNCIAPSLTNTKLAERITGNEKTLNASIENHPLKRIGKTTDISNAASFLLREESSWITGQIIHIDGGLSIK